MLIGRITQLINNSEDKPEAKWLIDNLKRIGGRDVKTRKRLKKKKQTFGG